MFPDLFGWSTKNNIRMYDDEEYSMIDVIKSVIESRASLSSFFLLTSSYF